jgi:hypothetical protein
MSKVLSSSSFLPFLAMTAQHILFTPGKVWLIPMATLFMPTAAVTTV